jgi:hypothetical protein
MEKRRGAPPYNVWCNLAARRALDSGPTSASTSVTFSHRVNKRPLLPPPFRPSCFSVPPVMSHLDRPHCAAVKASEILQKAGASLLRKCCELDLGACHGLVKLPSSSIGDMGIVGLIVKEVLGVVYFGGGSSLNRNSRSSAIDEGRDVLIRGVLRYVTVVLHVTKLSERTSYLRLNCTRSLRGDGGG